MFVVPPNYNVRKLFCSRLLLIPVRRKIWIPVPCNVGKTSVPTLSKHLGLQLGSDVHLKDTRTGSHPSRLSLPFSGKLLSSSSSFL